MSNTQINQTMHTIGLFTVGYGDNSLTSLKCTTCKSKIYSAITVNLRQFMILISLTLFQDHLSMLRSHRSPVIIQCWKWSALHGPAHLHYSQGSFDIANIWRKTGSLTRSHRCFLTVDSESWRGWEPIGLLTLFRQLLISQLGAQRGRGRERGEAGSDICCSLHLLQILLK